MKLYTNKSDYIDALAFHEETPRLFEISEFPKNDFSNRALESMKRSYNKSYSENEITYLGKFSSPESYDLYCFVVDTKNQDPKNQIIFDVISFQYNPKNEKFVAFQGRHYKNADDIEFVWKDTAMTLYDALGTYINFYMYPEKAFLESLNTPEFIERYQYFKIINY
ncbi:hypothetical protein [Pseudomonas syringae]|uniref:hypothetical protein n=1 Tax=Pseudomonas syringae TaxID=317 RepID=UPI002364BE4B|nr:hypothetical protein [Pseudomonas syringae]GKQ45049.1 hypothetical protein PSTH2693_07855 [Pseudomonas syringae pv. theae]